MSRSGGLKTRFGPTDAGLAVDLHPGGDYLCDVCVQNLWLMEERSGDRGCELEEGRGGWRSGGEERTQISDIDSV